MPTPTYPTTLPNQLLGLRDKREDNVVRTQMEAGPAITRRRYTASVRTLSVPVVFTGAQRAIFEDFFEDDLKSGSLSFEWNDPLTDETAIFRFTKPPEFTTMRGGEPDDRIYRATFALEILP